MSKLLHSLHQFWAGGCFQLSTIWVMFSILSALLNTCEIFKCLCLEQSLILLFWSLQFICFSGVIFQLYTNFDVDTLFLFDVCDGAVEHDAQSMSI
jgi:hypothetical protein